MPDRKQLFWLFFSLSGRISPAVYFLAGLLVFILQAFPLYRFTLVPPESAAAAMRGAVITCDLRAFAAIPAAGRERARGVEDRRTRRCCSRRRQMEP